MIGNDFETPIMYQDLANYTMGPMSTPFMANPYNTQLLGGTSMPRQLDQDKVEIMNKKEKQDIGNGKKVLGALGAILLIGAIPILRKNIKKAGGIGKYFENKWNSLVNFVKGNKRKQNSSKTFKDWFNDKWTRFKDLFKRNKQTNTP